jgi:DNA-binding GntR family transcriptional regulator
MPNAEYRILYYHHERSFFMTLGEQSLSDLVLQQDQDVKLERNLFKDRVTEMLRDYISTGVIPEGTKLTEREVSELLGVSRMPVHDALIVLETEGLVVRRGNTRYVVKLDVKDIISLYAVRRVLEAEAAKAAAQNANSKNFDVLKNKLTALEQTYTTDDHLLAAKCDMALHQEIWKLADNKYLQDILNSLVGIIFVLSYRVFYRMLSTTELPLENQPLVHKKLVEYIISGDADKAHQAMDRHLQLALDNAIDTLQMANTELPQ